MNSVLVRLLSAFAAATMVIGTAYLFEHQGIIVLSSLIIFGSFWEFSRVLMVNDSRLFRLSLWFIMWAALLFFAFLFLEGLSVAYFSIAVSAFWAGGLWLSRDRIENSALLIFLSRGSIGLIYCSVFPALALTLLQRNSGIAWFFCLLVVVFLGDSFAYFGGRFMGRTRLMKEISPKKTLEGALWGLVGSILSGVIFAVIYLPAIPWWQMALFSWIAGLFAQSGDLFVSLFKRVSNVKDSGHIMPGHGGILDRLDGVYFASPLFFLFSLWIDSWPF